MFIYLLTFFRTFLSQITLGIKKKNKKINEIKFVFIHNGGLMFKRKL